MALFHFTLDQIKRSEGRSAVNCAAYRSGEKLQDDYYGAVRDYTRKQGVVYTEIMLPEDAPGRLHDRQTLWNEVEQVEKHPKAQLAHSFEFSLQTELTLEENIELAKQFVQENFVARGMIADIAVHNPHPDDDEEPPNPHVHVLCPIRPLNEDGSWGAKQRREYLTDEDGNILLDKKGQKLFRAVPTTDWSTKETLMEYRKNWCELVNAAFAERGLTVRIDHRSYQDQGIELIPTIHEGVAVQQMEEKGIPTEKRALNNLIRFINRMIIELKQTIQWSLQSRDKIRSEIEKLEHPSLIDLLQNYYDERNTVADTFQYGTQKAKLSNLREFSETITFLESRGISSPEKLDELIAEVEHKLEPIRTTIAAQADRLKEVQNLIRMCEIFQETLPIHNEYVKKRFGKKKFYEEHKKELTKYQMASRIVMENRDSTGKAQLGAWRKEERELLEEKAVNSDQKEQLMDELKQLKKIRRCVDAVINPPAPEPDTDTKPREKPKEKAKEKAKERVSVRSKLEEKKAIVKEREANKQKGQHKHNEMEL